MKTQSIISSDLLAEGMSYQQYLDLIDQLILEGKATGGQDSETYLNYSTLNRARMKRIDKTCKLDQKLVDQLISIPENWTWLIITEGWCGDAAQNIPVLAALAASTPNIDLKIFLRDENLPLMDAHLTNGGRSIPKLVVLRSSDLVELGTWGPRPEAAQEMVLQHKQNPAEPYAEFVKKVQKWYNSDRNQSIQKEILNLVEIWAGIIPA